MVGRVQARNSRNNLTQEVNAVRGANLRAAGVRRRGSFWPIHDVKYRPEDCSFGYGTIWELRAHCQG